MTRVAFRHEWEKSGTITQLISKLNSGTEVNAEGGITFTAEDYDDLFFLLADGISHPDSITRNDVSSISYRAFLDLRKTGTVLPKSLIAEISKRIQNLQSAPRHTYTMWTKCRLRQMPFHKSCRFVLDDVNVRTAAQLPRWLKLKEHFVSGVGRIDPNSLPFFGYMIFSVEARNENEASKKIFSACDLLFAVINTSWRSIELWTQRRPNAKLWLGPNQFFFKNRKFLGDDRVWYNQSYDEKIWDLFPPSAGDFVDRSKFFRKILKKLEDHPLKVPIKSALILISEGMTSYDLAFRLMRFWSAAEALYAGDEDRTNTKKLLSRMTFASKEYGWIDKIKLERCYHLRNSYVHKGNIENDDTSLVQHLRELLIRHIYYYLWNADDIESHKDLLMMVDLPSDEIALEKQLIAIDRRLNLTRTGRHGSTKGRS